MQGNVRTMTLAEYNAGRTASVGAFCRNSPPRARHPLEEAEAEALSAGYKMNSNSRHQWTRRDHSSILGPNNEIRTKHDASLQGKANAQRLGLDIDDTDEGIIVGNKAYNSFMQNVRRNKKGVAAHGIGRAGSDADRTKGGSMNQSLRSEISRAINHGLIDKCNGVVKEGKEAVVYHAEKGTESEGFDVVRISYFFWSRSPTENRTSFSHTATCAFFATQAVKVFKRIQDLRLAAITLLVIRDMPRLRLEVLDQESSLLYGPRRSFATLSRPTAPAFLFRHRCYSKTMYFTCGISE
jgi:hypothetical protein